MECIIIKDVVHVQCIHHICKWYSHVYRLCIKYPKSTLHTMIKRLALFSCQCMYAGMQKKPSGVAVTTCLGEKCCLVCLTSAIVTPSLWLSSCRDRHCILVLHDLMFNPSISMQVTINGEHIKDLNQITWSTVVKITMPCWNLRRYSVYLFYMFGKVFLYGITFNIVYSELGHKNMKHFEYLFFHRVLEKISIF